MGPSTDGQRPARDDRTHGQKSKGSSGRGAYPEEQIEATIGSEQPLANARSRKASHYLGLFKENAVSHDTKKGKEKAKDGQRVGWTPEGLDGAAEGTEDIVHQDGEQAVDGLISGRGLDGVTNEIRATQPERHKDEGRSPSSGTVSGAMALSGPLSDFSIRSGRDEGPALKDAEDVNESIEWRSGSPSQGNLPIRLLEEIRNRLKLPLPEVDRTKISAETSQKLPKKTPRVRDIRIPSGGVGRAIVSEDDRDGGVEDGDESIKVDDDDDDYESGKEHISSATYFPYQAPSPEVSDDNLLGSNESADDSPVELDKARPPPTFPSSISDIATPGSDHSALALQTRDDTRFLPGDLHRFNASTEPRETAKSAGTDLPSTSDSDYESWDDSTRSERSEESGLTDDGERTPTAKPSARANLRRSRAARAPLGAVELKPYKHQVGGHTKVFSFSRQAICKELNNRENEFYEVLERRHPEMLKFLPRYAPFVRCLAQLSRHLAFAFHARFTIG
jgi:hypothetical protein